MMAWLAGLLGKGLVGALGDGILKPIMAHLDAKTSADRDRDLALIQAEIATNADRRAMATEFRPLVYLTALPFVLHSGLVMIDAAIPSLHIRPGVAPEPFASYEATILLSFFVLSPTATLAKGILARLSR